MKNFIFGLLLCPILLFAQEAKDTRSIYEFDSRCLPSLEWAGYVIMARQDGTTQKFLVQEMLRWQQEGKLEHLKDVEVDYYFLIVQAVYRPDSISTEKELLGILRHVEELCIAFRGPDIPAASHEDMKDKI